MCVHDYVWGYVYISLREYVHMSVCIWEYVHVCVSGWEQVHRPLLKKALVPLVLKIKIFLCAGN